MDIEAAAVAVVDDMVTMEDPVADVETEITAEEAEVEAVVATVVVAVIVTEARDRAAVAEDMMEAARVTVPDHRRIHVVRFRISRSFKKII